MGHGLAAAILCAETRAALLSLAGCECTVGEMVSGANRAISTRNRETSFVTLFLARFDTARRSLSYTSAGQGYGAVLDAAGEIKHELSSIGLPLGVDSDSLYGQSEIEDLVPGDIMVLVSDGICEAGAAKDDPFGRDRALDVVHEYRRESSRDIVETLMAVARKHCAPHALTDDVTVVVLKVQQRVGQ
jgi:serine phosphatase RsbU (regulator of sigma subunit)